MSRQRPKPPAKEDGATAAAHQHPPLPRPTPSRSLRASTGPSSGPPSLTSSWLASTRTTPPLFTASCASSPVRHCCTDTLPPARVAAPHAHAVIILRLQTLLARLMARSCRSLCPCACRSCTALSWRRTYVDWIVLDMRVETRGNSDPDSTHPPPPHPTSAGTCARADAPSPSSAV